MQCHAPRATATSVAHAPDAAHAAPAADLPGRFAQFGSRLAAQLGNFVGACLLVACSGGSGSAPVPPGDADHAKLALVITDAASEDLAAFEVDLSRLRLELEDGSRVDALASPMRVDFLALEDRLDLVATAQLAEGRLRAAILSFDFDSASVWLQDAPSAAALVDSSDTPITGQVDVRVDFSLGARPTIDAGKVHVMEFDLDLGQALTIDKDTNRVRFAPVLHARFDPVLVTKKVAVSGLLQHIDHAKRRLALRFQAGASTAVAEVDVDATTIFHLDGLASQGTAALAALAALDALPFRVRATCALDAATGRFAASSIEAGSGVVGNGQDRLRGWIVARSGGVGTNATLTLRGNGKTSSALLFDRVFTVTTNHALTRVLRPGDATLRSTDELAVGQEIEVFGTLVGTMLDASDGHGVAQLLPTRVFGIANGAPVGGALSLDLTRIGKLDIGAFDFMVGSTRESDPDAYRLEALLLSLFSLDVGAKVEAVGYVNPVGVANDLDFASTRTIHRSTANAILDVRWEPASSTGLAALTSSSLSLDVSSATTKLVRDGFDGHTLTASPQPIVTGMPLAFFTIVEGSATETHMSFAAFSSALQARLGGGSRVERVTGFGTFTQTAQIYLAQVLSVVLRQP